MPQALYRDGYRCIMTNAYDTSTWHTTPELIPEDALAFTSTNCAHILDRSTNEGIGSKNKVNTPPSPFK